MLINLTNHPSANWGKEQMKIAHEIYGNVQDIPFPAVDPEWETLEIKKLAGEYIKKILNIRDKINNPLPFAVHIQGEFTFTFAMVNLLKKENIKCIVSTSRRIAKEKPDGTKISHFRFVKFREYP